MFRLAPVLIALRGDRRDDLCVRTVVFRLSAPGQIRSRGGYSSYQNCLIKRTHWAHPGCAVIGPFREACRGTTEDVAYTVTLPSPTPQVTQVIMPRSGDAPAVLATVHRQRAPVKSRKRVRRRRRNSATLT